MASAGDTPNLPDLLVAEQTHLSLPSFPHWIEATVEYLRRKALLAGACHEARAGKVMVALHEALSNAIIHGNLEISSALKEKGDDDFARALAGRVADPTYAERSVDVLIDCNKERCRWIITDEGRGFDVDGVLRRAQSDDPELMLASGRGMLIMCSFLDEVRWELGGRRVVLTLDRESGSEKRRQPRVPVQQSLHIAPILPSGAVDWEAAYGAVATDLSTGGVGFLQQRLAETERVLIGLLIDGRMAYVPAEVRHCRTLSGDMVELGCRFQKEATASAEPAASPQDLEQVHAAVEQLLEKHQQPPLPKDDRRAHPRIVYTERLEVEMAHAGAATSEERVVGFARDLSKGGVAFITTRPLHLERALLFLPQAGGRPLRLHAILVRCVKLQEGFYDVAARFLHVDPTGG